MASGYGVAVGFTAVDGERERERLNPQGEQV